MLLEDVLPDGWWFDKPWYAAGLALIYSYVSIFIANQVFGANPGIVSVTFLTLFLLPSIALIRSQNLRLDEQAWWEKYFGPMHLTKAYSAYFIGTFSAYLSIGFLLPLFGINVVEIVKEQLLLLPAFTGAASFQFNTFVTIFSNNWFVLFLVFLFAVLWKDGGMFFVQWNASAWGAVFGFRAVGAAAAAGTNPWYYLGIEMSQVIWHVLIEGGAYILAAVSGSIIGRHAYTGEEPPVRFIASVVGLFSVTFGAKTVLESLPIPLTAATLIGIVIFTIAAYLLRNGLTQSEKQFKEGILVFLVSLAMFAVGAVVETFVLENSTSLETIYDYSNMFIRS
jgi:hypothetical protein